MTNLLCDDHPLQVLPKLATAIGLNEAIVLQQVHYWITNPNAKKSVKTVLGQRWVKNSFKGWQGNFPFWHVQTIKRIFLKLEKDGLLVSGKFNHDNGLDQTKWYTIDYDKLADKLASPSDELQEADDSDNADLTTRLYQNDTMATDVVQSHSHNGTGYADESAPDCTNLIPPLYQNDTTLIDYSLETPESPLEIESPPPPESRTHANDGGVDIDPEFGEVIKILETSKVIGLDNPITIDGIRDIFDDLNPPPDESRLKWFQYGLTEAFFTQEQKSPQTIPRFSLVRTIIENVSKAGSIEQHKINRERERKTINVKRDYSQNGNGSNGTTPGQRAATGLAEQYYTENEANIRDSIARLKR